MRFDPEKVTFFAKTDARGSQVPFGIKAKDRTRHMYIIGKTGMGKSTLLENMAVQDIQSGEGMAFIDPHGSTAEKLLEYVPEERIDDVVYFAPFDMEYPVSFNVMEDVGPEKRHLVVSGLMSTFKKIWVDAWSARMEYILSNTLLALLEYPDSTLLGVNRMLSDKDYRRAVIDNISDPSVKSFWVDEFLKYNERYMQEAGDAIKNKVGQFTANPLIRNIIGQPKSSFDIREIMDNQKILIMNLSKGLVGETNSNLLGSMLITRIYLAAMSRADLSAAKMATMPNFYFFVDEFQSFANETFANILSEARKYKLNLTIAHQYIEQMEEDVRDAVFGNVGTTVTFRVGPLDAEVLEPIFEPQFQATDLVNLGFAQIYLTLMIDGIGSRPFSAVTLPPIEQAAISYQDRIIATSRKKFAHLRAGVEAAIDKWYLPVERPKKESDTGKQKGAENRSTRPGGGRDERQRKPHGSPLERQNRKGDQYQKRGRQEGRSETYRTPKSQPPVHKDLGDLRSVLKTISSETASGAKRGVKGAQQKPKETRQNSEDTRQKPEEKKDEYAKKQDNLKSALRNVLENAPKKERIHDVEPEKVKPKLQRPVDEEGGEKSEKKAPETPLEVAAPSATEREAITRKQLERMLRITNHDKPPIRPR